MRGCYQSTVVADDDVNLQPWFDVAQRTTTAHVPLQPLDFSLVKNSRSAPSQRISEPKRSRSSIMKGGGSPAVEGEFQRGRGGSLLSPFARIKAKFLSC